MGVITCCVEINISANNSDNLLLESEGTRSEDLEKFHHHPDLLVERLEGGEVISPMNLEQ